MCNVYCVHSVNSKLIFQKLTLKELKIINTLYQFSST